MSFANRALQLGICTAGIYTCYIAYGVFQETLYKPQEDGSLFAATAFVLLVQCLFNAVVSFVVDIGLGSMLPSGKDSHKAASGGRAGGLAWLPLMLHTDVIVTSIVYVMAMYMSNEALQYVTYPTQALAKSCKMIPVLIGRVVITGERYSLTKYLCVLLMTVGIALFQFWGKKKMTAEGFGGEGFGMLLLAVSLVLDGVSGPFQEKLKAHHLTNNQQIVVNNLWASALMVVVSVVLGQFWESIDYVAKHPSVAEALVLFSLCSAFGQIFIFYTIRTFDSLTLSTITTTRKFFTIVTSVVIHGNVLATSQWGAVAIVFGGLALEVWDGERERARKRAAVAAAAAASPVAGTGDDYAPVSATSSAVGIEPIRTRSKAK